MFRRLGEKVVVAVAWALPRRLVYWCAIRLWAHGTTGKYGTTEAPSLSMSDAIQRWGR